MKKIGEILLDTGVLVMGDLISLKRMKQTPHSAARQFVHTQTRQTYTQGIDFQKFTDLLTDNLSVNEGIEQGLLIEVKHTNDTELSSENIINDLRQVSNRSGSRTAPTARHWPYFPGKVFIQSMPRQTKKAFRN